MQLEHELDAVQHDRTRDLIRDVRTEMRGRFDRMEDKVAGDPEIAEVLARLDRLAKQPRDGG